MRFWNWLVLYEISSFYFIYLHIFTLYPAHSRVGRGNLMLRHFVPHFLPNSGSIACWVTELNTQCFFFKFSSKLGSNKLLSRLQSDTDPLRHVSKCDNNHTKCNIINLCYWNKTFRSVISVVLQSNLDPDSFSYDLPYPLRLLLTSWLQFRFSLNKGKTKIPYFCLLFFLYFT